MAGQWVTTQEVIDELNRVKAEMATLKESYVASCMENQSLKSAKKTSKGPKPRNVRGISRMQDLDGDGFETPANRADPEDADDSEKEDGDGGENDGADPPKEPVQGRLDDPIQQLLTEIFSEIRHIGWIVFCIASTLNGLLVSNLATELNKIFNSMSFSS
ncbi:hypothetical protein BVRB_5g110550 [Beta vulgaris subsp. vulgaris]|nr:hypothetical protein BVRB_5g110550 [Beta vulgaris subsp. vulgaris]